MLIQVKGLVKQHRKFRLRQMKRILLVALISCSYAVYHLMFGISLAEERKVIAVLKNKDIAPYNTALRGFTETLRKSGISVELREFNTEEGAFIEGIKSQKPDLILSMGTSATKAAIQNIKDTPIVFSMVLDPEEPGFRGKNITGASLDIPVKTQFEYMKALIPDIEKIGVIYNFDENEDFIRKAKGEAVSYGVILITFPIKSIEDIPKFDNLDINLLWIVPDKMVCQQVVIKNLLISGLKHHIPVFGISPAYAKAGALLALSSDYEDNGNQAGEMVIKILRGEKPADIPVSFSRKANLYLNLAVAHRIGTKIQKKIIDQATEVFGR